MEPDGGKDTTLVHWDGQHESEAPCEDEEVFAEDFPTVILRTMLSLKEWAMIRSLFGGLITNKLFYFLC